MGFDWVIDDASGAEGEGAGSPPHSTPYRSRAPHQPRRILRLNFEIPIPTVQSVACLMPIIAVHAFALWVIWNSNPHAFARVIAPIVVSFLPPEEQAPPPDPPMLPAAALQVAVDPMLQILPPSVAIDAFESESQAISAGFIAPKKEMPEPVIAEIVEEEGGTFVRPRPIRGRVGKQPYPPGAAAAGESGRATVKICITARGTVESVSIAQSTGFERLDNDALEVARQYQFRPATRNGKAVPVCMPYSINYKIH